jgi:hypothetical protein
MVISHTLLCKITILPFVLNLSAHFYFDSFPSEGITHHSRAEEKKKKNKKNIIKRCEGLTRA